MRGSGIGLHWEGRGQREILMGDDEDFMGRPSGGGALLGNGRETWVFWVGGLLTWLGVRLSGVEPLKGGGGVVLDEHHCVAGFIAGGDLDAGRFGLDGYGHYHAWSKFGS